MLHRCLWNWELNFGYLLVIGVWSLVISVPPLAPRPSPLNNPAMTDSTQTLLKPGAKVKVTQQIAGRDYTWSTEVRGTVLEYNQKPTGSWFAHSDGDKLWLDRLKIRKDDGELMTLNLDEYTHIEIELPAPQA